MSLLNKRVISGFSLLIIFPNLLWGAELPTRTTIAEASSTAKYDQPQEFLELQAGGYRPASVMVTNGTYAYRYSGASLDTFEIEAAFGHRLNQIWKGSLFFQLGIAYAGIGGQAPASTGASLSSLHLNTVGLDGRLGYYFDRLPLSWLIPFIDGGYQYGFYFQSGSTDFESAQGTAGNLAAGIGLRFWLNPSSLDRDYFARSPGFPLYLSVKLDRIFPSGSELDLADTHWLAGLTVGL